MRSVILLAVIVAPAWAFASEMPSSPSVVHQESHWVGSDEG
jgi:hypothetical protein